MATEIERLRKKQVKAVMQEVGPLLDAWDGLPNDVRGAMEDEALEICHRLRRIARAMEG